MTIKHLFGRLVITSALGLLIPHTALAATLPEMLRPAAVQAMREVTAEEQAIWESELPAFSVAQLAVGGAVSPITTPTHSLPKPSGEPLLSLTGEASYYSEAGCLGCDPALRMANGQRLDDTRATVAIPAHLVRYVGRTARITNIGNGKVVSVPITDTGGFYQPKYGYRVADLSVATKKALGIPGGLGQIKIEIF